MNCCYNCNDRYIGCHGNCDKYAKFKAKTEQVRLARIADTHTRDRTISRNKEARRKLLGDLKK